MCHLRTLAWPSEPYSECMSRTIAVLIDTLPNRLWKPANLAFGARLHFCYGAAAQDGEGSTRTVRMIEWKGRAIARGHRPQKLT